MSIDDVRAGRARPEDLTFTIVWTSSTPYKPFFVMRDNVEVKGIKTTTIIGTPTDADKANGISWKGQVQIDFIDHQRAVVLTASEVPTMLSEPSGDYSEWISDKAGVDVKMQNGVYTTAFLTRLGNYYNGMIADTQDPLDLFMNKVYECNQLSRPWCKKP